MVKTFFVQLWQRMALPNATLKKDTELQKKKKEEKKRQKEEAKEKKRKQKEAKAKKKPKYAMSYRKIEYSDNQRFNGPVHVAADVTIEGQCRIFEELGPADLPRVIGVYAVVDGTKQEFPMDMTADRLHRLMFLEVSSKSGHCAVQVT